MFARFSRLLPALFLLTLTASAAAQEWTRFRGPNGTGRSDAGAFPAEWTEEDYRWKIELPGIGHSSPVIWGERVFVTSGNPESGELALHCRRTSDGSKIWEKQFPTTKYNLHLRNSFATSTPAVDREQLYLAYVADDRYLVTALDHDGKDLWQADIGLYKSEHGFGVSPVVFDDKIFINNDNDGESFLAALDRRTGQLLWKTKRKTSVAAYSTPCIRTRTDGSYEVIFNSGSHGITAVDPQTGSVNWELGVFDKRTVSSPLVAGGLVYGSCGSGGGGNYLVAVRPGEGDKAPELAYKISKSAPYVPTSVACDDLAFLWSDKGVVTCIDIATGDIHWQKRIGGNFSASPICIGRHIYNVSDSGEVVVLAASSEFQELARNPLDDSTRATLAIANGRLYLRTYHSLICVGK